MRPPLGKLVRQVALELGRGRMASGKGVKQRGQRHQYRAAGTGLLRQQSDAALPQFLQQQPEGGYRNAGCHYGNQPSGRSHGSALQPRGGNAGGQLVQHLLDVHAFHLHLGGQAHAVAHGGQPHGFDVVGGGVFAAGNQRVGAGAADQGDAGAAPTESAGQSRVDCTRRTA